MLTHLEKSVDVWGRTGKKLTLFVEICLVLGDFGNLVWNVGKISPSFRCRVDKKVNTFIVKNGQKLTGKNDVNSEKISASTGVYCPISIFSDVEWTNRFVHSTYEMPQYMWALTFFR